MKILVLSKYSRKGASSRYRMFQYFPSLQAAGAKITVKPLFDDEYLSRLYSKKSRLASVISAYFQRFFTLMKPNDFDVVWVEKELFPWIPWFVEKWFYKILNVPYVVEYDDAIFHQFDAHPSPLIRGLLSKKCDEVMRNSTVVIAGNEYLATRARTAGASKIIKIPTVVSKNVFKPVHTQNMIPVVGWIGSMSTAVYLEKLRPVFVELRKKHSFVFRVVGAKLNWSDLQIESIEWSEAQEVAHVQSFDIGIMPLLDSPWERGKCGFKLIQYMACGKPVIADPVGINSEIVIDGSTGYLTSEQLSWHSALERLLSDSTMRESMGHHGHDRFESQYSLEHWQETLFKLFKDCVAKTQ